MKERANGWTTVTLYSLDGAMHVLRCAHSVLRCESRRSAARADKGHFILSAAAPPLLGDRSHSRALGRGRRQIPLGQEDEHKGGRAAATVGGQRLTELLMMLMQREELLLDERPRLEGGTMDFVYISRIPGD